MQLFALEERLVLVLVQRDVVHWKVHLALLGDAEQLNAFFPDLLLALALVLPDAVLGQKIFNLGVTALLVGDAMDLVDETLEAIVFVVLGADDLIDHVLTCVGVAVVNARAEDLVLAVHDLSKGLSKPVAFLLLDQALLQGESQALFLLFVRNGTA